MSPCRDRHADVLEWLLFLNSRNEFVYRTAWGEPSLKQRTAEPSCALVVVSFLMAGTSVQPLRVLPCTPNNPARPQLLHAWCLAGDKDTFRAAFDLAGKKGDYYLVSCWLG